MRHLLPILIFCCVVFPSALFSQSVPRVMLIEEFTGTWAQWCPNGDDTLNLMLNRYPNTRAIQYHLDDFGSTTVDPMSIPAGKTVADSLAVGFVPCAVFDRIVWQVAPSTYAMALDYTLWEAAIIARFQNGPTSPMSISVSGTYDSLTRQLAGTATVTVLSGMTGTFAIHIVVTENDVDYAQTKNTGSSVIIVSPYLHKRVVRQFLTGPLGVVLTTTGFTTNQVIPYAFLGTLNQGIDFKNCSITVFVDQNVGVAYGHRFVQQTYQVPFSQILTFSPVELVEFEGGQVPDGIKLTWRTASETNNDGWDIERRPMGGGWQTIGYITGAGTTTESRMYEYVDDGVRTGVVYDYRLLQHEYDGTSSYSSIVRVANAPAPAEMTLHQNYPNPFTLSTGILVELPRPESIRLEVYDELGRVISTLANGPQEAGYRSFTWDGTDASGRALPSGTYFCRLSTPTSVQTRQMALIR